MNMLVKYSLASLGSITCLLSFNAHAASFDCTQATQHVEKMICSDNELSQLDSDLYATYLYAKERTHNSDAFKENGKRAIKWRNQNCTSTSCIKNWYVNRQIELRRIGETGFVAPSQCVVSDRHASITGRIVKKIFPGPPNYESVENGDKPLVYWILQTPQPLCAYRSKMRDEMMNDEMMGDDMMSDGLEKIAPQNEFQLSLDGYQHYQQYQDKVWQTVRVNGFVFSSFTGYHHTPLLIDVVDMK